MTADISAIRGPVITYSDDVPEDCETTGSRMDYEPDAIIMMSHGKILEVGPAYKLRDKVPHGLNIKESQSCRIIKISSNSK